MSAHRKGHRSHNQDSGSSASDWEQRSGIRITPNQPSRECYHHIHQATSPQAPFFGPFYIAQDPTGQFPLPFHATSSRRYRSDEAGQNSTMPSPTFHAATVMNGVKLDATSKNQLANLDVDILKEVKRRIARLHRSVIDAHEFYSRQLRAFDSVTHSIRSLSDDVVLDRMWRKKTENECRSDARVEEGFVCTPNQLEEQCDELKRISARLLSGKDEYDSKYLQVLVKSADSAITEAVSVAENARHSYKACQATIKMMEIVKSILRKEMGDDNVEEHKTDGKDEEEVGATGEGEAEVW